MHFNIIGNGTEWIDAELPTPNYFYRFQCQDGDQFDNYCVAWLINGFFGTKNGSAYLNDIIARLILTLPIKERLLWPPKEEDQICPTPYVLKNFDKLKSRTKDFAVKFRGNFAKDDMTFWELKLWIEYQIKENGGEGNMVYFDLLLEHALNFYDFKDRSTARSKCRNIWNWYDGRDWEYHLLKKGTGMSREEHIKKVHQNRVSKAQNKIKLIVEDMFKQEEIRFKNGKLRVGVLAKLTEMSEKTVSKHLKEMGLLV